TSPGPRTPTADTVRESGERFPPRACSRRGTALRAPTGTTNRRDQLSPRPQAGADLIAGRTRRKHRRAARLHSRMRAGRLKVEKNYGWPEIDRLRIPPRKLLLLP